MIEPIPRTVEEVERENAIMREALEKIANRPQLSMIEEVFNTRDSKKIAFRALCRVDNPEV